MILHTDLEQRSPEWYAIRAGKLTASEASSLITPTGRPSSQYQGAIARNIAEVMRWQDPDKSYTSFWMNQGINMEGEALRWFGVENTKVDSCGFIESDCGLFGCSPDGVYMDGENFIPVEIKCPMPSTLIRWHMEKGLPTEHAAQIHMAILITGAPYGYFMAYNPNIKPLLVKVERSAYTETLASMMDTYAAEFQAAFADITGINYEDLL